MLCGGRLIVCDVVGAGCRPKANGSGSNSELMVIVWKSGVSCETRDDVRVVSLCAVIDMGH